jgi:hypothetical protein
MVVDKDAVTEALRARGDHDRAMLAQSTLPRTVDTAVEAGTLHQLDLNVAEVEAAAEQVEAESEPADR